MLLGLKGDFQITNWLLDHKSGLHWQKMSKNHLENSHSALAEDSTAVTWVINHSAFIKRSLEKLLGSRGEFHMYHKVPPRPQQPPELAEKCRTSP